MKLKLHLTFLFLLFSCYTANAQFYGNDLYCYDCDFGIEVGGTLSNINGLDASEKAGLFIGLYNSYDFNDHWAIRFGLGYANLGARIKEYNTNVVLHTAPIEPISVHYTFKQKFKTFLGANLGMTFYGKNPYNEEEPGMKLMPESIKFFDVSLFAGGGYKLTDNLDLNLRYNLGMTNINNMEDSDAKWKNNWMSLSVAYTFR
ncbi:outer membrane beta-barrel protein [Myroides odoratus]|uniref:Outer membrane protein beta-barrel domain-containing protein n=1 Tax=Myroides odoratus TaxID=256 RepID=A0A378RI30_MYROD|nr:outer membrane beta-barrel protein [Myroides odoratus]QQU02430.1 outer membrane beta-barrel protein [Myroides odoratus]STZ26624.1 Uncharacterised protein [Myroides odoratus]